MEDKSLILPFNFINFAKNSLNQSSSELRIHFYSQWWKHCWHCGSVLSVHQVISLLGSCKCTNPVCHYRLGAEGHPRPGRPLQGEESGGSWRDILRPLLGVRQWTTWALRLSQWPRVRGQASRGHRGLRLPLEVQLLRGEAASQYEHLVCNLSFFQLTHWPDWHWRCINIVHSWLNMFPSLWQWYLLH